MQTYASPILYHLVGRMDPANDETNFRTLCLILQSMEVRPNSVAGKSGIVTRIDSARDVENGEPIEQSVCCFCDIHSINLAPIHTGKYGKFGVGVDRHWIAEWGGRPVIYIPTSSTTPPTWGTRFCKEVMGVWKGLRDQFPELVREGKRATTKYVGEPPSTPLQALEDAQNLITRDMLAFVKTFNEQLPDDHPDNFYMEREWRKFGVMPLHLCLRQIIVAKGYEPRIREVFPKLNVEFIPL